MERILSAETSVVAMEKQLEEAKAELFKLSENLKFQIKMVSACEERHKLDQELQSKDVEIMAAREEEIKRLVRQQALQPMLLKRKVSDKRLFGALMLFAKKLKENGLLSVQFENNLTNWNEELEEIGQKSAIEMATAEVDSDVGSDTTILDAVGLVPINQVADTCLSTASGHLLNTSNPNQEHCAFKDSDDRDNSTAVLDVNTAQDDFAPLHEINSLSDNVIDMQIGSQQGELDAGSLGGAGAEFLTTSKPIPSPSKTTTAKRSRKSKNPVKITPCDQESLNYLSADEEDHNKQEKETGKELKDLSFENTSKKSPKKRRKSKASPKKRRKSKASPKKSSVLYSDSTTEENHLMQPKLTGINEECSTSNCPTNVTTQLQSKESEQCTASGDQHSEQARGKKDENKEPVPKDHKLHQSKEMSHRRNSSHKSSKNGLATRRSSRLAIMDVVKEKRSSTRQQRILDLPKDFNL